MNIRNISAVQRPTPRASISRAMMASSFMRASARRGGMLPSSALAAMSLSAAVLAREKPQPRSAAAGVSHSLAGSGQAELP